MSERVDVPSFLVRVVPLGVGRFRAVPIPAIADFSGIGFTREEAVEDLRRQLAVWFRDHKVTFHRVSFPEALSSEVLSS